MSSCYHYVAGGFVVCAMIEKWWQIVTNNMFYYSGLNRCKRELIRLHIYSKYVKLTPQKIQ